MPPKHSLIHQSKALPSSDKTPSLHEKNMNKLDSQLHSKNISEIDLKKIDADKCEEIFYRIKKETSTFQTKWESLTTSQSKQKEIYNKQIQQQFRSLCTTIKNLVSSCSIEEISFLITSIGTSWNEYSQKYKKQQKGKTKNAQKAAQARHQNSPQGKAKQQVKEMWLIWQEKPNQYQNATAFAEHMLEKFPDSLTNPKTIQKWQTDWKKELKNRNENAAPPESLHPPH